MRRKANLEPRVILLTPSYNRASELFITRQMRMLAEENILESVIISDANTTEKRFQGVPIISLKTPESLFSRGARAVARRCQLHWPSAPSEGERLSRLLRKSGANTILCQYGTHAAKFLDVLTSTDRRIYVHVHGYDTHPHLCPEKYVEKLLRLAQNATILCNSQETLSRLQALGVPTERLVVKYMGVEIPPSPLVRRSSDEITILHLGRLVDCKSPDRTIEAFEIACDLGLKGQLVIAGDGPLRVTCELMRARSKWRDRIHILGAVDAVLAARLRDQADVFTLHSIKGELTGQIEGFGVAVVEAMAAALPVVSCRIGGIVESVVDNETGFLIEPGDVRAQAQVFLQLARSESLRLQMGAAGWQRAATYFSYEREKELLLDLIKDRTTRSVEITAVAGSNTIGQDSYQS